MTMENKIFYTKTKKHYNVNHGNNKNKNEKE